MIWVLTIYSIMLSIICAKLADSLFKAKQVDKAQENLIKAQQQKIDLLTQMNKDLDEECDKLTEILNQQMFADFGISPMKDHYVSNNHNAHLSMILDELTKIQQHNTDSRTKEIGDKVRLWDWSLSKVKDNKELNRNVYKDMDAIVIKTGCSIEAKCSIDNSIHILDTLIRYEDGVEIYTKSAYIKRTDNFEK